MFTTWNDLDRTLAAMDDFRRRMARFLDESQGAAVMPLTWPRANFHDAGEALVLEAELPGVSESDVDVTVNQDVLTVSGARNGDAPDGYSVHRQERAPFRFSRSLELPCKVSADRVAAALKDGILTVTLPKAPESQPRRISIKAS